MEEAENRLKIHQEGLQVEQGASGGHLVSPEHGHTALSVSAGCPLQETCFKLSLIHI